jgi:cysteinyl-tRNA synthetase
MKRLGVREATIQPKATEHMAEIIRLVEALVDKGLAYVVDGDVYFAVEKFSGYGMLSKRKLEDLQAGARVEVDERKRHPMDFALWKTAKAGEPAWESPWGLGRPGWHIECSAMAMKHLAQPLDIHGGGEDLIFPHHENEIAQSSGATGADFARFWVHNGFVRVNQEKMSKSLGNFFTIREIFEKSKNRWPEPVIGETLRYFLMSTHYRGPLDFSDQALEEAKRALDGFYDLFGRLGESSSRTGADAFLHTRIDRLRQDFRQSMGDDLNTSAALAAFQEFRADVNKMLEQGLSSQARATARDAFRSLGQVLALFQLETWQFNPNLEVTVQEAVAVDDTARIDAKVAERNEARRRKDFKKADQIRNELLSAGITIEDRPDGTTRWKR